MAAKLGAPRRRHSLELKRSVVEECRVPGASVAAIALARGLNANLVHQWLRTAAARTPAAVVSRPGFVEVRVPAAMSSPAPLSPQLPPPGDIRIELRRGATAVSVAWPVDAAAQCGAWLSELLR